MNKFAVFNNLETYNYVKSLGPLPSVELGDPAVDYATPRCLSCYTFTDEDVAYLESFEGVYVCNDLPGDWTYPPDEEY